MKYAPNASSACAPEAPTWFGHEVEDHGEAGGVGGVDEPGEPLGAAVARLRAPQERAVVAPAALAGELRDRHDLDDGEAELRERRQVLDGGVERPRLRERPDVQLVDDRVRRGRRREALVGPRDRAGVEDAAGAAQPVRLPARARVRPRGPVGDEQVVVAVRGGHGAGVDPQPLVGERVVGAADAHRDLARMRRPDAELGESVAGGAGAERALEGELVVVHERADLPADRPPLHEVGVATGHGVAIAPRGLRRVHRQIGRAHDVVAALVLGGEGRDAHAGRDAPRRSPGAGR